VVRRTLTKVLDGISTVIDPSQFQAQLADAASTSTVNTWSATQTFIPASGPAIVAQGDVHAGDGTHHVDSQGVVRIFGLGSVNEDGSLPTDYELLNVGWDGSSKYQLITEAGGTGVVRNLSLNGAEIDPAGNVSATSFTGDGSGLINLPIPSVGSPFTLTAHNATEVPLTITLATSQTANALNINSHGNSGGNLFSVDPSGNVTAAGSLTAGSTGYGGTSTIYAQDGGSPVGLSVQYNSTFRNVITERGMRVYSNACRITSDSGTILTNTGNGGPSLTVTLAAAQTANALEINSNSGSGGDVFKVDASGNATATTFGGVGLSGGQIGLGTYASGWINWNSSGYVGARSYSPTQMVIGVEGAGVLLFEFGGGPIFPDTVASLGHNGNLVLGGIRHDSSTVSGSLNLVATSSLPTATGSGNIIQQGGHLWYDRPSDSTWKQLDPP